MRSQHSWLVFTFLADTDRSVYYTTLSIDKITWRGWLCECSTCMEEWWNDVETGEN
jgi:hypothetical protein